MTLPLPVRLFNRAGGVLSALGMPLLRLDPETLLARARQQTGLDDFGDAWFRTPLQRLVESLEREAHLTTLGRVIARADLERLLINRLQMTDVLRRNPEITAAPIRRPLFVVGLPRTGTSILHELLAQDPDNRVPLSWEVMYPYPPPERGTYASDPRIAKVDKHLGGVDRLMPGFKTMHPMGAELPQECVAMTAHDFASVIFSTTHDVPSYQAWLDTADLRPVYAGHRRQLQYLQWKCPAERWALKSPGHLWALDALLHEYPDACVVQTHRDPLMVVASLASLVATLRGMASDHIDQAAIGAEWAARLADGLARTTAVRDHWPAGTPPPFDMHFNEMMRDEIGMVRRIYAHFGWTLSALAAERMRAFLAANARDKHGTHRYTLAAAGLDEASERARFRSYVERFGVAS